MPEIRHFLKYFQKHLLNAISPEEFFELEYGTDNWAEVIIPNWNQQLNQVIQEFGV